MSQLSGWLGCRQMAVYPLLCTNCVAVITMVSWALDDELIRFCVYRLTWSHESTVHHCYHMCVDGQATPVLVKAAIIFRTQLKLSLLAVVDCCRWWSMIICNGGELYIEYTVYRHQSDIVRVKANNPIYWGAVAVVAQNCLMIYTICSHRGEDNTRF